MPTLQFRKAHRAGLKIRPDKRYGGAAGFAPYNLSSSRARSHGRSSAACCSDYTATLTPPFLSDLFIKPDFAMLGPSACQIMFASNATLGLPETFCVGAVFLLELVRQERG